MPDASRPHGFAPWSLKLGKRTDPTRVIAKENWQRGGKVALITFPGGRKVTKDTGIVIRTAGGKIDRKREKHIEILMDAAHRALVAPSPASDVDADLPLTLGDTEKVLTDPETGRYPLPSAHQTETVRHLRFAVNVWGHARPWDTIVRSDWTKLARAVVNQFAARAETAAEKRHGKSVNNATDRGGYDTAVKAVKRVYTVAVWLADNGHIEAIPARPKTWLDDLKDYWTQKHGAVSVPEPYHPRHDVEQMRRIFATMPDVDPRGFLLLAIGAELRAGQVRRVRRSMVSLEPTENAPHGAVNVPGSKRKGGEAVHLTLGQRTALEAALTVGYLRLWEQAYRDGRISDYALFPGGKLRTLEGKSHATKRAVEPYAALPDEMTEHSWLYVTKRQRPAGIVGRKSMNEWFQEAEKIAKVKHVRGRSWYGLRRINVDELVARKVDMAVLKSSGGWKSEKVPMGIYADASSAEARRKAMEVRANIRGEATQHD